MDNLEERAEFWSTHYFARTHGKSMVNPYELTPGWNKLYTNNKVLEVGPGEGRQSDILMAFTRDYSVADIAQSVLDQDRYKDCNYRYLITDWEQTLEEEYETICFWYLVHHIKITECVMFFEFLKRALTVDGTLHFNYPYAVIGSSDNRIGDGIKTSKWSSEILHDCLEFLGFKYTEVEDVIRNQIVVVASIV